MNMFAEVRSFIAANFQIYIEYAAAINECEDSHCCGYIKVK